MLQITEENILESFDNYELDEIDLLELYSEGYISENTMDQLIEMGVFDETLEEGKITRGIREVGHQIKYQAKNIKAKINNGRILLNSAIALKSKNKTKAVGALSKAINLSTKNAEIYKSMAKDKVRHNIAQYLDAKRSGENKVADYYKNKAKELKLNIKN